MEAKTKSIYNLFFGMTVISLVGNQIAEFALLWYAINKFGISKTINADNSVSLFYVGQAIGVVVLMPLLSVWYDRLPKKIASTILDILYAGMLLGSIVLFNYSALTPVAIFFVTLITTALGWLHRGSVAFSAIKLIPEDKHNKLIGNYAATKTLAGMLGFAISGSVYPFLGFNGCMVVGILTFIPLIFTYFWIFKSDVHVPPPEKHYFTELKDGFKSLKNDKVLLPFAVSLSIFNISGAIIPAFLGIAFQSVYGENSIAVGIVLGLGLGISFLLNQFYVGKHCENYIARNLVPKTILPCIALVVVALFFPSPIVFTILYFLACIGSAFRNVTTMVLRKNRIPSNLISRVNSSYQALLYAGQLLGGLIVIPMFQKNATSGLYIVIIAFSAAVIYSFFSIPRQKVGSLLQENT